MKPLFSTFFLIFSLSLFSQTETVFGNYTRTLGDETNHLIEYKLNLYQDGTFIFDYYSYIKQGIPPKKIYYGKGTWKEENNVITFFTDKVKDIDEKNTLDFSNTKARFITKSHRDKTDRVIKTKLQFLESEINWMARIDMFKL